MAVPVDALTTGSLFFLVLAVGMALAFEFVNGFHDTANAVATVIYTNTMRPWMAVIWSGIWNLLGVLSSTGAVAFGILALLPVEMVVNSGSSAGFTMVFALLCSAIIWNLGTWYMGLPASSSHTLIGSIMGVGMVNSLMSKGHVFGDGVNWAKAKGVFMSLLISPLVGFTAAALLLLVLKLVAGRKSALFTTPPKDQPPPLWIRCVLVVACTGVSFAHGSNDGQKGMGLILLILIGVLPGMYALNMQTDTATLQKLSASAQSVQLVLDKRIPAGTATLTQQEQTDALSAYLKTGGTIAGTTYSALAALNHKVHDFLSNKSSLEEVGEGQRGEARTYIYLVGESIGKMAKSNLFTDPAETAQLTDYKKQLDGTTKFIPFWVKLAVALALGLGTMIGWKRIVTTVGEKIGKTHLTYGQGASAELVAMSTIGAADWFGLPVSTTHVLSSGVAGTMAANGSGLQTKTLISLLLAWVLTMPVCVILGSGTFAAGLYFVLNRLQH